MHPPHRHVNAPYRTPAATPRRNPAACQAIPRSKRNHARRCALRAGPASGQTKAVQGFDAVTTNKATNRTRRDDSATPETTPETTPVTTPPTTPPALPQTEAWAILETTPAMVWLGDASGNCVFLNRALRDFWGVADLETFTWAATLHPEDGPRLAGPYGQAMADQTPLCVEARYRRADGAWRWLRTDANPRFDANGRFTGMVGVNFDITDQREAEAGLRRSRDQLEFAIEAAGEVGTWLWDVQRDEIRADKMVWCGLDTSAPPPQDGTPAGHLQQFLAAIHPDDRPRVVDEIAQAVRTGNAYRTEFRIKGAGGERWVSASGRCEHDASGKPLVFAGLTVDVTDRRKREDDTLILSRELSHRLKNAFAIIQSMVSQSAQRAPASAPALHDLSGRIRALSKAHFLSLPDRPQQTGASSLRQLATSIVAPYCQTDDALRWTGPDIDIPAATATAFALILNELATNAAKYGSLSQGGHIGLTVRPTSEGVSIAWRESGGLPTKPLPAQPLPEKPLNEGFGTHLIRHSVDSLNAAATTRWQPDGLEWTLLVPWGGVRLRDASQDDTPSTGPLHTAASGTT